jgi:hypothetical protein
MPLEPIASPAADRGAPTFSRRRWLTIAALAVPGAVLAGCSSGTKREAERGRARDAERTSVMDAMQATDSARLLQSTPTSPPDE